MGSTKNGRWIFPFMKFGMIKVKVIFSTLISSGLHRMFIGTMSHYILLNYYINLLQDNIFTKIREKSGTS